MNEYLRSSRARLILIDYAQSRRKHQNATPDNRAPHTSSRTMTTRAMKRFFVACVLLATNLGVFAEIDRAKGFAIGGDVDESLAPLPKTVSTARYAEIEMMLMNAAREHLLGIFPTESSSYCEQAAVKRDWRRFARVIDGAGRLRDLVAMEVTHQGKDVALIADLKGKVKKHGSKRRFSCGFIAVARSNDMHVYEGDTSDGDALATWLSELTSQQNVEDVEEVRSRHEATEFVERNETVVRIILLERKPWLKALAKAFSGGVAFARASSLVGSKYLTQLSFDRNGIAGFLFVPDMENIEDEVRMRRVDVRPLRLKNETISFYDIAEEMLNAEQQVGYAAMMESTIDVDCANAVWQLASNSIHTEYTKATEGEESTASLIPPPKAWDMMKADLLDVLDGHGKGDKNLVPQQWLCGLAGLTAAHRDMANEYSEMSASVEELETLQKENLALRQRNAVLERELAKCDTAGAKAPRGAGKLPKAKPANWGFDAHAKKSKKPPAPTKEPDIEEFVESSDSKTDTLKPVRDEL